MHKYKKRKYMHYHKKLVVNMIILYIYHYISIRK